MAHYILLPVNNNRCTVNEKNSSSKILLTYVLFSVCKKINYSASVIAILNKNLLSLVENKFVRAIYTIVSLLFLS